MRLAIEHDRSASNAAKVRGRRAISSVSYHSAAPKKSREFRIGISACGGAAVRRESIADGDRTNRHSHAITQASQ